MRIEKLLNPKNDYVFKRIFGHVGNEDITKQMLNTILKKQIKEITVNENPILEKDLLDDKVGIVDICAKIDNLIDVDIEMQVVNQDNIEKRIMYYWAKLYIKGIKEGEDYEKLHKTIAILIADFELENLKEIPKFHTKWQIREEEYQSVILTDILELYIIELPKALKYHIENSQDIVDLRAWVAFLENPNEMEMVGMSEQNAVAIKKAKDVLEEISQDEQEWYLAIAREKHIRDKINIERTGYNRGIKEIARKMLAQGMDAEIISNLTGLTKEEIEKLK